MTHSLDMLIEGLATLGADAKPGCAASTPTGPLGLDIARSGEGLHLLR